MSPSPARLLSSLGSSLLLVVLGLLAPGCGGGGGGGGAGVHLVSLAITPPAPALALGFTQGLVATGTFSDMTTQDLTASVDWSTADAAVATVGNTAGTFGHVATVATGTV